MSDEDTESIVCCICLAEPKERNPLALIACGCKGGWFHAECENNWIDWGGNPLLCPVCRRVPTVHTFYSFHRSIGDIQHYLWRCILMSGFELSFYTYESYTGIRHAIAVPALSILFLLLPFCLPTNKPYSYYIVNTNLHNFYTLFSYTLSNFLLYTKSLSKYEYPLIINMTIIISGIHFIFAMHDFLLSWAFHQKSYDCFHEFVIGRVILHVDTLCITEAATDTRECDEGGGSVVAEPATTGEGSGRTGRHHRGRNH